MLLDLSIPSGIDSFSNQLFNSIGDIKDPTQGDPLPIMMYALAAIFASANIRLLLKVNFIRLGAALETSLFFY